MRLNLCIVQPAVRLLTPTAWLEDTARIIEHAGRLSHKSEDRISEDSAAAFIHSIAFGLGHESIVEHGNITVLARMSRVASHQWVRHRISAYTQESQRYCDYSHEKFGQTLEVICPPSILPPEALPDNTIVTATHDPSDEECDYKLLLPRSEGYESAPMNMAGEAFRRWAITVMRTYGHYTWLRQNGIKAEDARFVLPNATKTELAVTYNIRSWRHFFEMRCTKHAQWEIRKLAQTTLRMFMELAPWGFGDPKMQALLHNA